MRNAVQVFRQGLRSVFCEPKGIWFAAAGIRMAGEAAGA